MPRKTHGPGKFVAPCGYRTGMGFKIKAHLKECQVCKEKLKGKGRKS
jgi:hypothetical protein